MKSFLTFIKKYGHLLFWPVVATIIFIPTFGKNILLPSPDWMYVFSDSLRQFLTEGYFANANSIAINDFLEGSIPPLFYHNFSYWLNVVLAATGFYWFMRERALPKPAALFGGGVMAFAGYSFTLISAGHHAYFEMMPYIPFTFAFIARAIRKNSIICFALAGCTAAWVFRFGPDIGTSMMVVAAFYAIWLFIIAKRSNPEKKVSSFAGGCAIAVLAFAIVAAPSIYTVITETLTWRKNQIEESSGTALTGTAEAKSESSDSNAKTDDEKWIFATNWSLPPNESLELIAPAYKGTWNGDPRLPYWGELGRSYGWSPKNPGNGFFNFRQHIIYIGAIPVALLAFALLAYATSHKKDSSVNIATEEADYTADVPFWLAITVIGLLLAFGRYTPFYRLFYAIPGMSYLRAPVKFIRIVEFSSAALAASGLASMISGTVRAKAAKWFAGGLALCAVILLIFTARIGSNPAKFAETLLALNARQLIDPAIRQATGAIWHGIIGFALTAAIVYAVTAKWLKGTIGAAILTLAVAIDLAIAVKPFMFVKDYSSDFTPNAITKNVTKEMYEIPSVTIIGFQSPEWLNRSLSTQGVRKYPYDNIDHNTFLTASNGDVARMCQLTGSQLLLLPVQMSRALDRTQFEHVDYLAFSPRGTSLGRAQKFDNSTLELLKVKNPMPYARMYAKSVVADSATWYSDLAKNMGHGNDGLLQVAKATEYADSETAGTAVVRKRRFIDGSYRTEINTDAPSAQLLFVNEVISDNLNYLVDGAVTEPIRAGYLQGVAIQVPAGQHTVTIKRKLKPGMFVYSTLILLVVIGLASVEFNRCEKGKV